MTDIKLSVIQKVEQCFVLAENYFGCVLIRPKVGFDIRGQDAGRAYFPSGKYFKRVNVGVYKKTEIKFNDILLEDNPDFFLENIVAHECAHLIVYELFGTKVLPHGKEWKGIMENVFKADSSVKHNLNVESVTNKPFIYSCACEGEGIALSQRQHNAAKKGASYLCRRCKGELSFKLEKKIDKKKLSQEIDGLFFELKSANILNDELFAKINNIVGRKRPLKIYSSVDLSKNQTYLDWLRAKSLVRRYQGEISRNQLEALHSKKEISHALIVIEGNDFSEKQYWEDLRVKGLVLRHINI